jgi:hypothetical protein
MLCKNRAFALAAATAALVGLSAPAAGAATFQGPSGFNNDSVVNVSGNQIPVTVCNVAVPADAVLAQIPITGLGLVGNGTLNSNTTSSALHQNCTQTPTQSNTSTTNTNSNNAAGQHQTTGSHPGTHKKGTSGFNNDSIVNVSGNQIPAQICNVAVPITATVLQVPLTIVGGVLGTGALNSSTQNPSASQGCTQTPGQASTSTVNTNSNNGHN